MISYISGFVGLRYIHVRIYPQVGTNGYLSFDKVFTDYEPFEFPGLGSLSLVAPFFCDIDISDGTGVISYEVHALRHSPTRLAFVSTIVNEEFGTEFEGTWMLVAEWKNVPAFGRREDIVSGETEGV